MSSTQKSATKAAAASGSAIQLGEETADDLAPQAHIDKLNQAHPHLRIMVNQFLRSHDLPLQLHSMQFTSETDEPADQHCCMRNGRIHCDPSCP